MPSRNSDVAADTNRERDRDKAAERAVALVLRCRVSSGRTRRSALYQRVHASGELPA